jgi:hypothetical protein
LVDLPPVERQPEAIALVDALARLNAILHRMADAFEKADGTPRMALRLDELAKALGVSRRAIERERSAGRVPQPDLHIGKMPLWRIGTIRNWLEGGGPK